jgi:hypothetical protein
MTLTQGERSSMKRFLLRLFYWLTCTLRMCDDSEFIGWFIAPIGDMKPGGVYRTRCPICGRNYVRNTSDPFDGKLYFDDFWSEQWERAKRREAELNV